MNNIIAQWSTKILTMKVCLRILILFPLMLKCYEKFSPIKYSYLKKCVTINGLEIESIKSVVKNVFVLCIHFNFMLANIVLALIVCTVLSEIIRKVGRILGYYVSCNNQRRKSLLNYILVMYTYGAIIIYDIALLSDLILNDVIPFKIINSTSVFWVSKFPVRILTISILIVLILPVDIRYNE